MRSPEKDKTNTGILRCAQNDNLEEPESRMTAGGSHRGRERTQRNREAGGGNGALARVAGRRGDYWQWVILNPQAPSCSEQKSILDG